MDIHHLNMAKVARLSTPFKALSEQNNHSDDQISLPGRLFYLRGSYFASSLHADVVKYESTTELLLQS